MAGDEAQMTNENERQAATMKVGISTYVATATLALLAGTLGIFGYVKQNFQSGGVFQGLVVTAIAILVLSIILGGRGANQTAEMVASGSWVSGTSNGNFNGQAISTVVGLLLVIVAAFVGINSKPVTTMSPPAHENPFRTPGDFHHDHELGRQR